MAIYFCTFAIISIGYYNTGLIKIAETWEHSDITVRLASWLLESKTKGEMMPEMLIMVPRCTRKLWARKKVFQFQQKSETGRLIIL